MKVVTHLAAGAVISTITGVLSTPVAGLGVFITSGFLDIDHIHHYRSRGFPLNPKALLHSALSNETELETEYSFWRGVPDFWGFPVFHCVEFIILVLATGYLADSAFLLGCGGGIAIHLLMDIRHYPFSPHFFSLVWRWINRRQVLKAWETWKK